MGRWDGEGESGDNGEGEDGKRESGEEESWEGNRVSYRGGAPWDFPPPPLSMGNIAT